MIVIGCADSFFVKDLLKRSQSDWSYEGGSWVLHGKKFNRPSSGGSGRGGMLERLNVYLAGLLFLVKKAALNTSNMVLFLQSSDPGGLERALRLFPIRTGVLVPDWLVVDERANRIGAAGVDGAG